MPSSAVRLLLDGVHQASLTKMVDNKNEHFVGAKCVDADDPLRLFDSQRQTQEASSPSRVMTFFPLAEFPTERTSPPVTRPAHAARPVRRVATAAVTLRDNRRESTRAVRTVRATVPAWSIRVRWAISLAVLLPPLMTLLVFRSPFIATAGRDDTQDIAVTATSGGVDKELDPQREALLPAPTAADAIAPDARSRQSGPKPFAAAHDRKPTFPVREQSQPAAAERRVATSPIQPVSGGGESDVAVPSLAQPIQSADATPVDQVAPAEVLPAKAVQIDHPVFQGTIRVDTQPAAAQVYVDGKFVGVTPLITWQLPAGSHVVRIERQGYERWSGAVRAVANETVNLAVTLQPRRQN